MLHCYSKKNNPVSLALRQGHFELREFPFISKFRISFETQLIETTKCIPTVYDEMRYVDNFNRNAG